MTPADVAGFMLFHEPFPRSVAACVAEIHQYLTALRSAYGVPGVTGAMGRLDELRTQIGTASIDSVIHERGLHQFLDDLQRHLNTLSVEIGRDLLGHGA
jgi:uncharacterized alpha-E superfamily protein